MSAPRDPKLQTAAVVERARALLAAALRETSVELAPLADGLGLAPRVCGRWVHGGTHAPLYVLAHPAVPLATRLRLAADLLALARALQGTPPTAREALCDALLDKLLALAALLARALRDRRVDDGEAAAISADGAPVRALLDRLDATRLDVREAA